MSLDTGGTTSPGPDIPAQFTDSLVGYNYGIIMPEYNNITSVNGLYQGSLSAQGNMIAMQLNPGGYRYVGTGQFDFETGGEITVMTPYLTGYFREYWRNPASCTFGADSPIPALTGVMPSSITGLQGNAIYYIDLQLTRLSGSNFFNNYSFINNFNQSLNWVTSSNRYLAALNNVQGKNLEYFKADSYQEFLTQGFSRYSTGNALRAAIGNMGFMVREIRNGRFGTPNSVAKYLIENGLGAIGNLAEKLILAGVNFVDIYDPLYTQDIKVVLESITNQSDLDIIQTVVNSTIPDMITPMDYTSIEKCSGTTNDSVFVNFEAFGLDIFERAPNLLVEDGKQLLEIIDSVLSQTPSDVESLATPTSLLPQEIIDGLRSFLPVGRNNGPISLLNVIGMASGYLLSQINEVNNAIAQLTSSKYGNPIRSALALISTSYKLYIENVAASQQVSENSGPIPLNPQLEAGYKNAITAYYSVLDQAANDPLTLQIVDRINTNWLDLCQSLYLEVLNYNKAGITSSTYQDNSLLYGFINSLPSYAADSENIGTDFFLFGLCQSNQAGDIVKSILNQYKNNEILGRSGVTITGRV